MKLKDLSEQEFLEQTRPYIADMLRQNGIILFRPDSMKSIDETLLKIGKTYHEIKEQGEI